MLAGLTDKDTGLDISDVDAPGEILLPKMEHTYEAFPWLQNNYETLGQRKNIVFKPLYEIEDEAYTLYFTIRS